MVARAHKQDEQHSIDKWPFGPKNYAAFGLGLLSIVLGYVFLSQGSITAAPILLVLGYCVIIPIAIMIK
ncbi:MAG: hypothetical protein MUE60_01415 [Candidatus Eisenbacteria bacterium]|jgi:hypothetical protein|nr:hypothetical protein [Candidatus Eisenbacteria bacterium]